MKQIISLAAVFVLAASGTAGAGGQKDTLGLGAEFALNGETGGVSANYDVGKFHVGGFLGFIDGGGADDTDITFGARFFYHLHATAMSDLGIGGTFGVFSDDPGGGADRIQRVYIEPAFQIRLFLASNVALSFTAGITIGVADADGVSIGGQNIAGTGATLVTSGAGIHYYFF